MDSGRIFLLGPPMEGVVVTVLMAVRDTPAAMLRQAIESIRRQTWKDFEFLILDDGSQNAETRRELERHAAADSRIRLQWEPHRGLSRTLNRGLALAEGEWIARQDADDWSEPERLERQVALFQASPAVGLCGSNAWTHRQDGTRLWPTRLPETVEEVRAAFWQQNPFVHGSTMYRATAARDVGAYREEFPCAQDYDFFWRLTDGMASVNLREPLYHYRYSSDSVSVRRAADQARAHRAALILAQVRQLGGQESIEHALAEADQEVACGSGALRAALKQADHRMLAGDFRGAGRAFLDLQVSHPGSLLAWGKLLRWALFSAVPPARRMCFR